MHVSPSSPYMRTYVRVLEAEEMEDISSLKPLALLARGYKGARQVVSREIVDGQE